MGIGFLLRRDYVHGSRIWSAVSEFINFLVNIKLACFK